MYPHEIGMVIVYLIAGLVCVVIGCVYNSVTALTVGLATLWIASFIHRNAS